jgi:hypothetical protein
MGRKRTRNGILTAETRRALSFLCIHLKTVMYFYEKKLSITRTPTFSVLLLMYI